MTEARKYRLGFRHCANPDCDHPVHHLTKECPSCGAAQNRKATTQDAAATPSVGTTEQAAPQVQTPSAAPAQVGPTATQPVDTTPTDGPYIVAADCRPQIGDVMCVLKAGAVLTDHRMIQQLLAAGAPIVAQNATHGLTCCPKCQTIFAARPIAPTNQRRAG